VAQRGVGGKGNPRLRRAVASIWKLSWILVASSRLPVLFLPGSWLPVGCAVSTAHPVHDPGRHRCRRERATGPRCVYRNSHRSSSAGWLLRKRCTASRDLVR
jgi:hypothetical protein